VTFTFDEIFLKGIVMRKRWIFLLLLIFILLPASVVVFKQPQAHKQTKQIGSTFPAVDRDYLYDQFNTLVTQYQSREAGYSESGNGHDGFVDYWSQEISGDLQGFGEQVKRDPFTVNGWASRAANTTAFNVEVTVPGLSQPGQVVVIGCHYDGMANSTQSAYDDGSGCAIELGIARAMADYWRSNHVYPTRTLKFVMFDAEEQGMYGSFHYVNDTLNGDLGNIIAMFNLDQNGIAFPLRYLGKSDNPLLPLQVMISPLQNNSEYNFADNLSSQQIQRIQRFRDLMNQAPPAVFAEIQAMGIRGLSYHDANGQDMMQAVFTADQVSNVQVADDTFGHSDQVPFTLAGVPNATFEGTDDYYDSYPPAGAYPYDQQTDTIQLMNTYADGSSQKSNALALALMLPGMLTSWMLIQSDILGETAYDNAPLACLNDLGSAQTGQSIAFAANLSFQPDYVTSSQDSTGDQNNVKNASTEHPGVSADQLSYTWDFGDQSNATGENVSHTFTTAGQYTVTLTVRSEAGQRRVQKTITVVDTIVNYVIPYRWDGGDGTFNANWTVTLPTPDDSLSDQIQLVTVATPNTNTVQRSS
jgi:plastocyanin